MTYESIADAYNGKTVFITGATGFLGKVILEKLLYSCPGIKTIYILVREKHNQNANQRIQNILEQPLFSRVREERPHALEKVKAVVGDISEPKLGIKDEDENLLIDTVSIVIHVAATIKFNETLEVAVNLNVTGTGRVLNLTRRMKNIMTFVYVSTAYSNTNRQVIEEVVYPAPASLQEVKKLIEIGVTEDQVKELIKGRPNTYTFTKALAENLVSENHGPVPAVIVRPSIVCGSESEPLVGWIDNWFGATALMTSIAKGINRVVLADPNNALDLIPVDYVSNLVIAAAAKCESSADVAVYNCSTSGDNPLSIKKLSHLLIKDSLEHKFYDLPMPFVVFTRMKWLVLLITFLLQTLPSYIGDIILVLAGKKPRFMKLQGRVILVRDVLEYFTSNTWSIGAPRTISLYKSLSESDKRAFPFNPKSIDWDKYIPMYCGGIRKYLCNDRSKG